MQRFSGASLTETDFGDSKYFSSLEELFSVHCVLTLSGGLSLPRFLFPLKTNSKEGVLIWFEEGTMVITVHLFLEKWWLSLIKHDWSLPEKLSDFWPPDSLRCSGIRSTDRIRGSALYLAFHQYQAVHTFFYNCTTLFFLSVWEMENWLLRYFREILNSLQHFCSNYRVIFSFSGLSPACLLSSQDSS